MSCASNQPNVNICSLKKAFTCCKITKTFNWTYISPSYSQANIKAFLKLHLGNTFKQRMWQQKRMFTQITYNQTNIQIANAQDYVHKKIIGIQFHWNKASLRLLLRIFGVKKTSIIHIGGLIDLYVFLKTFFLGIYIFFYKIQAIVRLLFSLQIARVLVTVIEIIWISQHSIFTIKHNGCL